MKQCYCLILVFLGLSSFTFAQNTILKGQIIDKGRKEPLTGAYVHLENQKGGSVTDAFGHYEIKNIPPGSYKLKVRYIGYTEVERDVNISAGQPLTLNLQLEENSKSLNAVNIYATANPASESSSRRSEQHAANVTNVISAQAMQRSPDISAANALQRVSAVTLQRNSGSDEAFAIIRGLEPRYSNTLVNGVKVTSPDPVSRFISLSVVPSDLLDKIEVSKTLTPEMEGDAIGGTVNLIFKDAPDYEYIKANASVGYSGIFLNRKYDQFAEGAVAKQSPSERFGPSYRANPGNFSRANLDLSKRNAPLTSLLGFTYGRRFLNNKLGFIVSDSYQNQYYGTNSQFNIAQLDARPGKNFEPVISSIANRVYSTQQLNNGLSTHLDYRFNEKNKLTLDNVYLYTRLAQARLSTDTSILGGNGGRVGPGTGTVFNDNRSSIQNQYVENLKLGGKHVLTKHIMFDWSGIYSNAIQNAPDRANVTSNHLINPDFTSTPDYLYNVSRIWQRSGNKDLTGMANLGYKTPLSDKDALELKIGALYRHTKRFNIQDQYTLKPAPTANGVKSPYTDVYAADWLVYDVTGSLASDKANYTAYENIAAAYGEFKLTFDKLNIVGGLRIEDTQQGYDTHPVVMDVTSNARKTYRDVLPSANVTYKLTEKSNLRASYFKSIARPALYELVPTPTYGQTTDVTGNPSLQHTEANNYDLRYELYPGIEQQFFIGGFYKDIKNPIEFGLSALTGGQLNTAPQNFGTAKVAGAEVVYSRYFGDLGVSGNYTYTHSSINTPKIYTSTDPAGLTTSVTRFQNRPMQGQSGNVANLSLLYKNDRNKAFVQLAYTYTSKTLALVYNNYGYDYYQQPQSFLSLSGEKQVSKHLVLTAKANNLLNTPTTIMISNLVQSKDVANISFNVGIRYSH